jgi:hypothetical protein
MTLSFMSYISYFTNRITVWQEIILKRYSDILHRKEIDVLLLQTTNLKKKNVRIKKDNGRFYLLVDANFVDILGIPLVRCTSKAK